MGGSTKSASSGVQAQRNNPISSAHTAFSLTVKNFMSVSIVLLRSNVPSTCELPFLALGILTQEDLTKEEICSKLVSSWRTGLSVRYRTLPMEASRCVPKRECAILPVVGCRVPTGVGRWSALAGMRSD
jgi:hypothetical protein